MIQLSGLDGLFINMEMRGLPMHISSFSVYDPASASASGPSFDQIKQTYASAVEHCVPALKVRLQTAPMGIDQPYWVEDPDFNIDLHLRRCALPDPGDWQTLIDMLGQLHGEPLQRDKPLWEAWVIENLGGIEGFPEGSFGIFLKAHHALMDGRTGLKIFTSLHALDANEPPMAIAHRAMVDADGVQAASIEDYQAPSVTRALAHTGINYTFKTLKFMQLASGKLPNAWSRIREGLANEELQLINTKEKTCFNDVISQRRVVDRIRLPIATLQAIRAAVPNCTLNEVALTIISGALRRYLLSSRALPEASLVATVPIDVRAKEDRNKMGNRISIMNVALASNIEDELERLKQVHTESSYSKSYSRTLGKDLLSNLLDSLYPVLLNRAIPSLVNSPLFNKFPCVANTLVTNVPGASVPLYFSGARLVESFGMGPLVPNTSLFHTITSTCDWISISFVSCPESMQDPALYRECLQQAYEELAISTGVNQVVIPMAEASPNGEPVPPASSASDQAA